MLIRAHDQPPPGVDWRDFVESQGWAHLIAGGGPQRSIPVAVPTQFRLIRNDEAGADVALHLAANNPIFEAIEEHDRVLLSVAGDWAYIPGQWKMGPDEDARLGIPTTYYAAVQLECVASVSDDAGEIADVLRLQTETLEQPGDLADPMEHAKRFPAIRAIRLEVTTVRAKFKYGGNLTADRRETIADRLTARSGPGDAAAAGHSRRFDERPTTG